MTRIFLLWYIQAVLPVFSALAEPNRLRIIALLRERPRPVGEIAVQLQLRQPQVSKHLRILSDAGLVEVHPAAQQRIYALKTATFEALDTWLDSYRHFKDESYDRLEEQLEQFKTRSQEMTTKTNPGYAISLPSDTELIMTRTFNAPRALVFKAHVDPALVAQWWGPRGTTTRVDKLDARVGGAWRFVVHSHGVDQGFRGEYRELNPSERFAWTFEWEGMPGHIGLETYVFTEHEGKTTLTTTSHFNSRDERDGMLANGMESGANESADRLDDLLAALQA